VPDIEIVRRVVGRRVCAAAGHNYHVEYDPPSSPDRCDRDGSPLLQRDDDKPAVVWNRLQVYHEETAPLVEYYLKRDLLRRIAAPSHPMMCTTAFKRSSDSGWRRVARIPDR
jgi:adenylate kinase